jgi:hypothetical protein
MVLCFVLFYVYFEFYKSFTVVFLVSLFSIMCYYLITVTVFLYFLNSFLVLSILFVVLFE